MPHRCEADGRALPYRQLIREHAESLTPGAAVAPDLFWRQCRWLDRGHAYAPLLRMQPLPQGMARWPEHDLAVARCLRGQGRLTELARGPWEARGQRQAALVTAVEQRSLAGVRAAIADGADFTAALDAALPYATGYTEADMALLAPIWQQLAALWARHPEADAARFHVRLQAAQAPELGALAAYADRFDARAAVVARLARLAHFPSGAWVAAVLPAPVPLEAWWPASAQTRGTPRELRALIERDEVFVAFLAATELPPAQASGILYALPASCLSPERPHLSALCRRGADLDAQHGPHGRTVLHEMAATPGADGTTAVRALLEQGAAAAPADNDGRGPLHGALTLAPSGPTAALLLAASWADSVARAQAARDLQAFSAAMWPPAAAPFRPRTPTWHGRVLDVAWRRDPCLTTRTAKRR